MLATNAGARTTPYRNILCLSQQLLAARLHLLRVLVSRSSRATSTGLDLRQGRAIVLAVAARRVVHS